MDKYFKKNDLVNGYSILKIIGEGRYGIAYLAEDTEGQRVVVKQLKKEMLKESREKLFYEVNILKTLNDSKFPKFIDRFREQNSEGYILEYIEGTVMYDYISRKPHRFTKKEIYEIASKIIDIIEVLQNNNIVHRDIRLPNIIMKENKDLVLIDFGLARVIDGKRYEEGIDYWFLGDSLIHLYYTAYYHGDESEEKPWYEELELLEDEKRFLMKLMNIKGTYMDLQEIKDDFEKIKYASQFNN